VRDLTGESERVTIEFSKDELEDLIGHVRTGQRLRPGTRVSSVCWQSCAALGPVGEDGEDAPESTECPLERDTPDDVSWLADWIHGRLHELTDGDERAVIWKQAHLIRFLLGRLHDWLEESEYPTAAVLDLPGEEALVAHVARYLEHIAVCPIEPQAAEEAEERG
jgi:hypothetical protein